MSERDPGILFQTVSDPRDFNNDVVGVHCIKIDVSLRRIYNIGSLCLVADFKWKIR